MGFINKERGGMISVIVPVYNSVKYLDKCIQSILNQTYKNFELLLVNDGSSDNSLEICNLYALKDDRVKVIDQSNGGVSSARNAGIDYAKGEWITFVDSDDWVHKDYLLQRVALAEERNADVVYCDAENVYEKSSSIFKMPDLINEKTQINAWIEARSTYCWVFLIKKVYVLLRE